MTDFKLALKITTDGAGQAKAEIEGIARAEDAAGDAAARAVAKIDSVAAATGGMGGSAAMAAGKIAGMGAAVSGLSFGALISELTATDKALQNVNARIDFFAGSASAGAAAQAELHVTAKTLHADYLTLADTYAKLIPLEQAGVITHQQTIGLLAGMSNAGKALGASNAQLSGSFYGLSQALSSSVVHAEELNQVVEPLPGLLQAMDRAASLPSGGLRQLVNDGKVTNTMFADILVRALREFDGAAAATAGNIADSEQRMKTAWQDFAATFEKPINFAANGLATFFEAQVSDHIGQLNALKAGWNSLFGREPDWQAKQYAESHPRQTPQNVAPGVDEVALQKRLTDEELRMSDDLAEARQAAAEQQQRNDRAVARTKIELLKATGETVAALRAEAEEMGLTGQAAITYVANELKIAQAKEQTRVATESHTASLRDQAEAERLLKSILDESMSPMEKFAARQAAVEQAMGKVTLTTEEMAQVSRALNAEMDRAAKAWGDSDAAMNAHVRAYESMKAGSENVIAGLKAEAEQLKRSGVELEIYNNEQRAGAGISAEYKAQIDALTRSNAQARKLKEQTADDAKVWGDAWQQATRRVDDTFRNLWADVFNGSKSVMGSLKTTFLDMLAEMAHAAITRPIMVSILGSMGAPVGTANAGTSGGLGGAAGSAFSSVIGTGISKALGGLFGGSSGAAGSSALMGTLGTVGGGALIGAAVPSLLGIKGGGTVADKALPIAGGIGGAMLGSAAMPAFATGGYALGASVGGAAMGVEIGAMAASMAVPIVGVIGAAIMAIIASTIKKAPPKATAELSMSSSNALSVNSTSQSGGASSAQLVGLGGYFTGATSQLERALGVEVGGYGIGFNRRGRDLTVAGSAGGMQFFNEKIGRAFDKKGNLETEKVQAEFDRFLAALIKRKSVLAQVDDELTKGAIRTSDTLTEISGKLKTVAKIRGFEDRSGGLAATIDALVADYEKYERRVTSLASKASRGAELQKLGDAFARQFEAQARTLRSNIAQAAGGSASLADQLTGVMEQFDTFRAQDEVLRKVAAKSKGKISYAGISAEDFNLQEAAAVRKTVDAYFSAAGAGIEDAVKSVKSDVQGIVDSIAGPTATITRLSADIGAGMAALGVTFDAEAAAAKAADITAMIKQRYALEAQAIQDQLTAAKSLKALSESLTFSDLSPLSWQDQFGAAKSAFEADAAKLKAGDTSAALLNQLNSDAQQYLAQAKAGYARGNPAYQAIFDQVKSVLDQAGGISEADATAKAQQLQADTVNALGRVSDALDVIVKNTTDQALAAQAKATGSELANSIAPYLDANSVIVDRLNRIKTNTGATAGALK